MDAETTKTLTKLMKGTDLGSAKKAIEALALVGVTVTALPKPRRGYEITTPKHGVLTVEVDETYKKVPTYYLTSPAWHCVKLETWDGTGSYAAWEASRKVKVAALNETFTGYKAFLKAESAKLLGLADPAMTEYLPARARDYRTDLTIRTCPICFRDIKATDGTMADHGFTIKGRDYSRFSSGRGGHRMGSCLGVEAKPWEVSPEATKGFLVRLEEHAAGVEVDLTNLKTGKVTRLPIEERDPVTREMVKVTIDPTHPKWGEALKRAISDVERELAMLWSSHFGGIPWFRMAIRTWAPHPATLPAIGAPMTNPEDCDCEGKPV